MGVDCARFGSDRSALAKRRGQELLEPVKTWQNKDLMELAGIILTEYEACRFMDRPTEIYVDAIGVGAGLADRLAELDLPAVSIAVSESPSLRISLAGFVTSCSGGRANGSRVAMWCYRRMTR